MKPEDRENIKSPKDVTHGRPPEPGKIPGFLPGLPAQGKITPAKITVNTESGSDADRQATGQLLDLCKTDDGYQCPRCEFTTTDAGEMIEHLADEINTCMATLASACNQRRQAKKQQS